MTKQEQIEEMAKLLRNKEGIYREEIYPCEDDMPCEKCCCLYKSEAEVLYEAGYRKTLNDIRELIDVLSEGANLKEKLNKIKRLEEESKILKEVIDEVLRGV